MVFSEKLECWNKFRRCVLSQRTGLCPRLPHFPVSPTDSLLPRCWLGQPIIWLRVTAIVSSLSAQLIYLEFKRNMTFLCLSYHLQVLSWGGERRYSPGPLTVSVKPLQTRPVSQTIRKASSSIFGVLPQRRTTFIENALFHSSVWSYNLDCQSYPCSVSMPNALNWFSKLKHEQKSFVLFNEV